jgi:hypothetical protein
MHLASIATVSILALSLTFSRSYCRATSFSDGEQDSAREWHIPVSPTPTAVVSSTRRVLTRAARKWSCPSWVAYDSATLSDPWQ